MTFVGLHGKHLVVNLHLNEKFCRKGGAAMLRRIRELFNDVLRQADLLLLALCGAVVGYVCDRASLSMMDDLAAVLDEQETSE